MRRKKNKVVQLDLFQVPELSFEDQVFSDFREYAYKLMAKGFNSICHDWWRSRFHDFVYPGHNKPKDYNRAMKMEKCWPFIWKRLNFGK